ncbi:hypothetical protein [Engelhardtia mirabilis]|uniref:hypothetical protein n=1 Tax=Engelhardtia mirabilis TaxID=2528011 RepID=UPI0011A95A76
MGLLATGAASCASFGAHRLDQLYYLGVFDPSEQVPPAVYRVRVTGWSAPVSTTNYAAGWVPAAFVDSLGTTLSFHPETRELEFQDKNGTRGDVSLKTGRRMMLFGPEGFREAPADHRLAVVMSSDPSDFFSAIDDALGQLSAAKSLEATSSPEVTRKVTSAVSKALRERSAIESFETELEAGQ